MKTLYEYLFIIPFFIMKNILNNINLSKQEYDLEEYDLIE